MERTRIVTRTGATYVTTRPAAEISEEAFGGADTITVETVVGLELLPPETATIRCEDIMAVQSMSEENWALQVDTEQAHYRRLLSETPQEQLAAAVQRMVPDE